MIYDAIDSLRTDPFWIAVAWALLINVAMFVSAMAAGDLLLRRFANRRILQAAEPLNRQQALLAGVCVFLNAAVAMAGIALWREGILDLRPYGEYGAATVVIDALVLFVAMDLAMYVFHRVAHHPILFPLAHQVHHDYDSPKPLTLFLLSPVEVIGFGVIWLLVLIAYTASVEAVLVYLAFNLAFGLNAHLGVETAPERWIRLPVLGYVSTSTFHALHHKDRDHNYGFYLVVWDRLFGTLSPEYEALFTRVTAREPARQLSV